MGKLFKNRQNRCRLVLSKLTAILLGVMLLVPSWQVYAVEEVSGEMSDRLRFVDLAGLVGDETPAEIEEKLGEISTRQKMDVVIVTTNSLDGKTATEYADDFYDDNNYGYGEDGDGILLLVDMGTRKWALSTKGQAIPVFTDAGQEYMTEQFLPYLSDGKYEKAFDTYAELCDEFITHAYEDEPYDVGNLPKTYFKVIWIPASIVFGFLLSAIMAFIKKSEMKSIVKQQSASGYTKEGGLSMTTNNDRFINSIVTTRIISSDDSSSGGGSSTHTSSSGSCHGGSSGSF